jgi:hypothetical protein
MDHEQYIFEALDLVLAWDLPEEAIAEAANQQAKLMAGYYPEEFQASL